jgi:hypothetical protein
VAVEEECGQGSPMAREGLLSEALGRVHSRAMTKQLAVLDPEVMENVDEALIASLKSASPDIVSLVLIAKKGVDMLTENMRLEHERDMKTAEDKQREKEAVRQHEMLEREAANRHELALITKRDNPRIRMGVLILTIARSAGVLLEIFGSGGSYILGVAMAALVGAGGWMARAGQEEKSPQQALHAPEPTSRDDDG